MWIDHKADPFFTLNFLVNLGAYLTNNFVAHNIGTNTVRFTQSARKHKIGKARAISVLEGVNPQELFSKGSEERRFRWVGVDNRGLELEIIGVLTSECLLIIHVMPSRFKGVRNGQ